PIRAKATGDLHVDVEKIRSLEKSPLWASNGARLELIMLPGAFASAGGEVASIVPRPDVSLSPNAVRQIESAFDTQDRVGTLSFSQLCLSLFEFASEVARRGDLEGSRNITSSLKDLLTVH